MSFINFFEKFVENKTTDNRNISETPEQQVFVEEDENLVSVEDENAELSVDCDDSDVENSYEDDEIIEEEDYDGSDEEFCNGLTPARTILLRSEWESPSWNTLPLETEPEMWDENEAVLPSYDEAPVQEAMAETSEIAKKWCKNKSDDENWELNVNKIGWSNIQRSVFTKVARILDQEVLGRLVNEGSCVKAMQCRAIVDSSAAHMRQVLATIAWDFRLIKWLHCLLLDALPPFYMTCYLDILQTLRTKLPTLMERFIAAHPPDLDVEILTPVLKKKWEPQVAPKVRNLNQNAVIVALPSMPSSGPVPSRLQKWYQHLATMTQIVQVTLPIMSGHISRQPLEQVAEQIVSLTRVKIQELRSEDSTRSIILMGFNAGASMALQVAMSENVACVVCMGFAFNTFKGTRGTPDDRILDIKVPILFVVGQHSARTSIEEIESLREKMQSDSSLVIVGCADDVLRVPKSRCRLENVTQAMVDTMVVDEVYDFIKQTLLYPPGPRVPTQIYSTFYQSPISSPASENNSTTNSNTPLRKRKYDQINSGISPNSDLLTPNAKFKIPNSTRIITGRNLFNSSLQMPIPSNINLSTSNTNQQATKMVVLEPLNLLRDNQNIENISVMSNEPVLIEGNQGHQVTVVGQEIVSEEPVEYVEASTLSSTAQNQYVITNKPNPSLDGNIQYIPSDGFLQLAPPTPSYQNQSSKMYTQIPATNVNNFNSNISHINQLNIIPNVSNENSEQQHIFTLKAPSGETTQIAAAKSITIGPETTCVVPSEDRSQLCDDEQIDVIDEDDTNETCIEINNSTTSNEIDINNIINLPIVFADKDGNITGRIINNRNDIIEYAADEELINNSTIINNEGDRDKTTTTRILENIIINPAIGQDYVEMSPSTVDQQFKTLSPTVSYKISSEENSVNSRLSSTSANSTATYMITESGNLIQTQRVIPNTKHQTNLVFLSKDVKPISSNMDFSNTLTSLDSNNLSVQFVDNVLSRVINDSAGQEIHPIGTIIGTSNISPVNTSEEDETHNSELLMENTIEEIPITTMVTSVPLASHSFSNLSIQSSSISNNLLVNDNCTNEEHQQHQQHTAKSDVYMKSSAVVKKFPVLNSTAFKKNLKLHKNFMVQTTNKTIAPTTIEMEEEREELTSKTLENMDAIDTIEIMEINSSGTETADTSGSANEIIDISNEEEAFEMTNNELKEVQGVVVTETADQKGSSTQIMTEEGEVVVFIENDGETEKKEEIQMEKTLGEKTDVVNKTKLQNKEVEVINEGEQTEIKDDKSEKEHCKENLSTDSEIQEREDEQNETNQKMEAEIEDKIQDKVGAVVQIEADEDMEEMPIKESNEENENAKNIKTKEEKEQNIEEMEGNVTNEVMEVELEKAKTEITIDKNLEEMKEKEDCTVEQNVMLDEINEDQKDETKILENDNKTNDDKDIKAEEEDIEEQKHTFEKSDDETSKEEIVLERAEKFEKHEGEEEKDKHSDEKCNDKLEDEYKVL